ncbi:MAG: endolytic transglycosylase MltG, partial [Pseudomonadota bacterium]
MSDPVRFGRGGARSFPAPTDEAGNQPEDNKKRRRKNSAARNQFVVFFNFLFSCLVFTLIAMAAALYFGKTQFEAEGPHELGKTFTVRSGANVAQVANALRREGLISNSRIFEYGVRAYRNETELKAGEYEITAGASMKEIMDRLVEGRAILYPLTVVEGWTVFRAMQEIAANEFLTGEMPEELPPEGTLVADTQKFGRGTDRAELISRM